MIPGVAQKHPNSRGNPSLEVTSSRKCNLLNQIGGKERKSHRPGAHAIIIDPSPPNNEMKGHNAKAETRNSPVITRAQARQCSFPVTRQAQGAA